jgi:hypothetical protein
LVSALAEREDREHLDEVRERVGFSNGCAALALKKPPPLVPSILIATCEATGPARWSDAVWRAMPRTRAAAMAMPAAADVKLWMVSATICEKYDMVDSPP